MICKILGYIKTCYYKIAEYMSNWTKKKDLHIVRQFIWLDKLSGSIQKKKELNKL